MPGFSLIELIIVILIASLFAALIFNNVNFSGKKKEKVGIRQLKDSRFMPPGTEGELLCVDKCRQCAITHGKEQSTIASQLKPIRAYTLDEAGNPQEIDFGRAKSQKVCLRFHYYANGSTSQMILESDDTFYFIPSYFGDIKIFDGLDAAVEHWTHYRGQLDAMGTFY